MEISGVDPMVIAQTANEARDLLSELIRIDTSNPPGDETKVAKFLDSFFRAKGLEGEIVGEPPDRRSYVLRLEGRRPGPSLLLLAHEDVVPVTAIEWQEPPFSGVVDGNYVWGRGALDVKNLIAAHAVALCRLAASGGPYAGTIVFAATADEEDGSVGGARWLLNHRPDLLHCDYVLNEGGAHYVQHQGRHVYIIETGEKGAMQFKVIIKGQSGHASLPLRRGSAMVGATHALAALSTHASPLTNGESSHDLISLLVPHEDLRQRLRDPDTARAALAELAHRDEDLADMIEPLYGFSFTPTMVASDSAAVNMHPSRVEISVDCRTPVGMGRADVAAEIQKALAGIEADWELEWLCVTEGNASPAPTRFSAAIARAMDRLVPGSEIAFAHGVRFTDCNWFRTAYPETIAYGFSPYLADSHDDIMRRCHARDERIHVRDLALQALHAEFVARELLC